MTRETSFKLSNSEINWFHFTFSVIAAVCGWSAWYCPMSGYVTAFGVNAYAISILLIAALKSDNWCSKGDHYLPHRTIALIVVLLLIFSIVMAFAGLYLEKIPGLLTEEVIYESFQVLGFNSPSQDVKLPKSLVMFQWGSGLLLLLAIFPLLISRIADWKKNSH